jgi:hypothetical protein
MRERKEILEPLKRYTYNNQELALVEVLLDIRDLLNDIKTNQSRLQGTSVKDIVSEIFSRQSKKQKG